MYPCLQHLLSSLPTVALAIQHRRKEAASAREGNKFFSSCGGEGEYGEVSKKIPSKDLTDVKVDYIVLLHAEW